MYITINKFGNKIMVITYYVYCLCINIIIPYYFIEFLLSIIIYIYIGTF